MQGPRSVQEDGADGQPPVVDGRVEEHEETMPDAEYKLPSRSGKHPDQDAQTRAHLDQNELMQQDTPPHICQRDAAHDDEGSDHKSLCP